VLPVEGAPLVFSTGYAHGVTLKIDGYGRQIAGAAGPPRMPLKAATWSTPPGIGATNFGDSVTASLHGILGPSTLIRGRGFRPLMNAHGTHMGSWAGGRRRGRSSFGRQDTVHLRADQAWACCVDGIMLKRTRRGKELKVDWKSVKTQ